MGLENRKPTDEEMKRMKENLAKGIDEGNPKPQKAGKVLKRGKN